MIKPLLVIVLMVLPAQCQSHRFYVDRTEVSANYGSIYILQLANQLIPPDKLSSDREIDCLIGEIKKAGIFGKISWNIAATRKKGTKRLRIVAAGMRGLNKVVIDEIELLELSQSDEAKLRELMKGRGVSPGQQLTSRSLNLVMENISKSFRELSENANEAEIPWIGLEMRHGNKIRLLVSPFYRGCGAQNED